MAALAYAYESSFVDRVSDLLSNLDCRLADIDADREAIYRLRYEAYMREGGIEPNSAEKFFDDYDESENVWIFGLYWNDELASSIRDHVATKGNLFNLQKRNGRDKCYRANGAIGRSNSPRVGNGELSS